MQHWRVGNAKLTSCIYTRHFLLYVCQTSYRVAENTNTPKKQKQNTQHTTCSCIFSHPFNWILLTSWMRNRKFNCLVIKVCRPESYSCKDSIARLEVIHLCIWIHSLQSHVSMHSWSYRLCQCSWHCSHIYGSQFCIHQYLFKVMWKQIIIVTVTGVNLQ